MAILPCLYGNAGHWYESKSGKKGRNFDYLMTDDSEKLELGVSLSGVTFRAIQT